MLFVFLENIRDNHIHDVQLTPLKESVVDYSLIIYPLFIVGKSGVRFFHRSNSCSNTIHIGVPLPSFFFYCNIVFLPVIFLVGLPILLYYMARLKITDIIARNYLSSLFSCCAKVLMPQVKVIADLRSLYPEEGAIVRRWSFQGFDYKQWRSLERFICRKSDKVFCISPTMKSIIDSRCAGAATYYVPAFVPSNIKFSIKDRLFIRDCLGISDKLVFIYVGSFGLWHTSEALKRILRSHVNPENDAVLLYIGNDSKRFGKSMDIDNLKIINLSSIKNSEMFKYLSAADVSILPGNDSNHEVVQTFNSMLQPSKFQEYLACGLPVLLNDSLENVKLNFSDMLFSQKFSDHERLMASKKYRGLFSQSSITLNYVEY